MRMVRVFWMAAHAVMPSGFKSSGYYHKRKAQWQKFAQRGQRGARPRAGSKAGAEPALWLKWIHGGKKIGGEEKRECDS
jgi:hypothetical protein